MHDLDHRRRTPIARNATRQNRRHGHGLGRRPRRDQNKIAKDFQLLERLQRVSQGGKAATQDARQGHPRKDCTEEWRNKGRRGRNRANDDDDDDRPGQEAQGARREEEEKVGRERRRERPASEDEADDEVEEEEKKKAARTETRSKGGRPQRVKPGTGARRLHRRLPEGNGRPFGGCAPHHAARGHAASHSRDPSDMRLSDDAVALMCASILRLIPRIPLRRLCVAQGDGRPDNPRSRLVPSATSCWPTRSASSRPRVHRINTNPAMALHTDFTHSSTS